MPEFIDSIYVHRPVDEADIPRRRAEPDPVRIEPDMPAPALPSGPWSTAAHAPATRSMLPDVRQGRDLAPLFVIAVFVWIVISCAAEIIG